MLSVECFQIKARAKLLEEWLFKIFDKTIMQPDGTTIKLGQAIMDHCSVTVLTKAGNATSYVGCYFFQRSPV